MQRERALVLVVRRMGERRLGARAWWRRASAEHARRGRRTDGDEDAAEERGRGMKAAAAQGAEPSDASTHEVSQGAGADGSRSTGCRHPC